MIAQTIRRRLLKPPFAQQIDLSGKHYVVTGCSRGSLGFATASILLRWGASVMVTTRSGDTAIAEDLAKHSGAPLSQVVIEPLDLRDTDSVANFVGQVQKRFPDGLNALINNAGIHLDPVSYTHLTLPTNREV